MTSKNRPDMATAMAAFLARGGVVQKTAPATAEVQREIARAQYRADRAHERTILAAGRYGDGSPVEETEEARHIRIHREHVDAMADAAARARGDV